MGAAGCKLRYLGRAGNELWLEQSAAFNVARPTGLEAAAAMPFSAVSRSSPVCLSAAWQRAFGTLVS